MKNIAFDHYFSGDVAGTTIMEIVKWNKLCKHVDPLISDFHVILLKVGVSLYFHAQIETQEEFFLELN